MYTLPNKKLLPLVIGAVLAAPGVSFAQESTIVQMIKRNSSSFALDGNRGGESGQNVYIYDEGAGNVNQQWYEINRGNGFYSYQKLNTEFCLDGNRGGERGQNVHLWSCNANNFNQHWLKVDMGSGHYRLEKRNASGFSLDGGSNGENEQNVHLWSSDNANQNQHWYFNVLQQGENAAADHTVLPATLEAEDYDSERGTEIEQGSNGGEHVAYIQNGDYTEYQVYVPNSGTYTLSANVASANDGGTINILSDNDRVGSVAVPGTGGWNSFQAVSSSLNLESGNQTLRLAYAGGDRYLFNVNSFSVTSGEPIDTPPVTTPPQRDYNVSTLFELRDAVRRNNQDIVMKPGTYNITDLADDDNRYFLVSGNNNTIDLTGVTIYFPVEIRTPEAHFYFSGRGNTLIGGTIENTYVNGATQITDFVSYNADRRFFGNGGKPQIVVAGNDTSIIDTRMIVRGSFPYGYGSYFGINHINSFGLEKRSGIQVNSTNTLIDGVYMQMDAFGHGIYIGPGEGAVSDNTIIRNTTMIGQVRQTNDMLAERGSDSLMQRNNYRDADGNPIPRDEAESMGEDGIRAYGDAGDVLVENSVVRGMRSGIRLLFAGGDTRVVNTVSTDNRISNYDMFRGGKVEGSTANFTYGPALQISRFHGGQEVDLTLQASPNSVGVHDIANIERDAEIVFRRVAGSPIDSDEERVIRVSAGGVKITNYTEYTIELESGTSGNEIISAGPVVDRGSNNVRSIPLER